MFMDLEFFSSKTLELNERFKVVFFSIFFLNKYFDLIYAQTH